jgi:hypothetical protein
VLAALRAQLAATNGTIFGNDNAWSSMNPNIVSDQVIYQKIPDNGIFMLPLWLGFYGAITLVDIGTYNDLQSDRKNSVTIAVLLLWVFAFFVSVFCMNLCTRPLAPPPPPPHACAASTCRLRCLRACAASTCGARAAAHASVRASEPTLASTVLAG